MEEIKVGEYVRSISGEIDKVDALYGMIENTVHLEKHKWQNIKNIVKHSPNIIDLMQVKDVIEYIEQTEGREGTKVGEIYITDIHSKNELNEIKKEIQKNGIKLLSVTTKEQINQVKYEV